MAFNAVSKRQEWVDVDKVLGGSDYRREGEFFVPEDASSHDPDGQTTASGKWRGDSNSVVHKRLIDPVPMAIGTIGKMQNM